MDTERTLYQKIKESKEQEKTDAKQPNYYFTRPPEPLKFPLCQIDPGAYRFCS
jgi:hypothetical protein